LQVDPYESKKANHIEIFNELTILAISEHLYLFTDFMPDSSQSILAGWSLIGIILFNVLFHMLHLFVMSFGQLRAKLQPYCRKYCP
jgi:hypothetical protein